jgi:hypothetical protein
MDITRTITPFFGDAVVAPIGLHDRNKVGLSPVTTRVMYYNYLNCPVTIVQRTGLRFQLQPIPDITQNRLTIQVKYSFNHSQKLDITKLMSTVNENSPKTLQTLKEVFMMRLKDTMHQGMELLIDYHITSEDLKMCNGTMYHHKTDNIISMMNINSVPQHPFSEEGINSELVKTKLESMPAIGFGYNIELVDNSAMFGARYINIGNDIYKVDTIVDSNRKDGAYIVSNVPTNGKLNNKEVGIKYIGFDLLEESGFYKTAEEAKALGDISISRKFDLAELEHTATIKKAEMQKQKLIDDLLTIEKEKEAKVIDAINNKHADEIKRLRDQAEFDMKMQAEREKAFYDARARERADKSDAFKIMATIIGSVGALALAIAKFK